jgi:hypothetical protein
MSIDAQAAVQSQLDAFNARDLSALLAIYTEDAELYEHPDKLMARGTEELSERFSARFQEPNLHAVIHHRIVAGQTVIDHETVTRTFAEGPGRIDLVMIYEVRNGRISRAWTIAGARTLEATTP